MHIKTLSLLSVAASFGLTLSSQAFAADTPSFSLSVERIGGLSYTSLNQDPSEERRGGGISLTGFTLASPVQNPLSTPRIGFDFLLPSGWTLGGALSLGLFSATLEDDPDDDAVDLNGNFFLLSPRVGYRVAVSETFDLTPRGGLTFVTGGGSATSFNCYSDYPLDEFGNPNPGPTTTTCSEDSGDLDFSAVTATLEVAGAYRVTDSFNLLVGASADMVLSADASVQEDEREADDADLDGSWNTFQLWLGMGGYF